jgi:hypothetical protein
MKKKNNKAKPKRIEKRDLIGTAFNHVDVLTGKAAFEIKKGNIQIAETYLEKADKLNSAIRLVLNPTTA